MEQIQDRKQRKQVQGQQVTATKRKWTSNQIRTGDVKDKEQSYIRKKKAKSTTVTRALKTSKQGCTGDGKGTEHIYMHS